MEASDAEKLAKCATKFIEKCQKAESKKGNCSVFGDCSSLADDADTAAALNASVLMP